MDVDEAKEVGDDDLEVEQQKANAQLQKECKVYGKEIAQERKINKSMARNTLHVQSSLVLDQKWLCDPAWPPPTYWSNYKDCLVRSLSFSDDFQKMQQILHSIVLKMNMLKFLLILIEKIHIEPVNIIG